jgi:hypothetical protein
MLMSRKSAPESATASGAWPSAATNLIWVAIGVQATLSLKHVAVGHLAARGEHDDGNRMRFPNLAAQGETVRPREHHVEDDDVGKLPADLLEPRPGRRRGPNGEFEARQVLREERAELAVVVDDEDGRHGLTPSSARDVLP